MKHLLILLTFPLVLAAQPPKKHRTSVENPSQALATVIHDYYAEYDRLFPLLSESKLYPRRLENYISQPHRDAQKRLYETTLRRLAQIPPDQLPEADRYQYEILQTVVTSKNRNLGYEWYLIPESSFGPNRILGDFIAQGSGNRYVTFATVTDYDNFLKRIDVFADSVCDTVIHYMRLGIRKKIVQPRRMMELVLEGLEPAATSDLEKNPFYEPILKMPDFFPAAEKQRLQQRYREAIEKKLRPAYARAINFIRSEYIPACRETIGICAYPWGKAAYQQKLDEYYGGALPPDSLLVKVRVVDERYGLHLAELMNRRGFRGSPDSFFRSLPVDSFHIFHTKQEVIDRFYSLLRQVHDSIPKYFGLVPRSQLEVLEEPNSDNRSGGARFTSGSADGSRPDRIYLSIGDPLKANYTVLPVGCLHEGDPGHHFSATNAADIREFHAQVLKDGPMPLAVLDKKIHDWVATRKKAAVKPASE
jgi:uncharacterized protein (DUF885 family)